MYIHLCVCVVILRLSIVQSVVERKLQKEKNLSKHDLGRDAFIDEVWKWNEQYGGKIMNQLDHIGAIVEKDQSYFTLDETRCVAQFAFAGCELAVG